MMTRQLTTSMITMKVITCMIPSYVVPPHSISRIVDGGVRRWPRCSLLAIITMCRNSGEGLKSFVSSFGALLVSYLYERVDHHLLCVQSTYISFTITHHTTYICVYNYFQNHTAVALVWVVLKQRRMMSREDAIVEEAAMNGIGLKKRHVFPIALGIIFFILFSMFMVWKKLTWILLMGTNIGLFAHFVYLRRKAKRAGGGGEGYIKDAGLEIS